MSKVSQDSAAEFQRMIEQVFDLEINENNASDAQIVRPSWVLVPTATYIPKAKQSYKLRNEARLLLNRRVQSYKLRNEVLTPMLFQSRASVSEMRQLLEERATLLKPNQELAVNTTIIIGWDNGVVAPRELEIYDGAPLLRRVNKKTIDKFNVLATENSYHFYAKGRAELEDIRTQVDDCWLTFRREGAGYIRVTHNVKKPILRLRVAQVFVPAPPEADCEDPDYGF